MTENNINNIRSQMRKGILEYCVLQALSHRRLYPSDILSILKEARLIVVEGTIYTLLNRLKREGKLSYEWEESPKGPPRKYYYLTDEGDKTLEVMSQCWKEMVESINLISRKNETNP